MSGATSAADGPPLHPDLAPLAELVGTWRGSGRGEYPNVAAFTYTEELVFEHSGRPFLVMRQRTSHPETGMPMHTEVGFWRMVPPDRLELVVAHPTGLAEVEEGTVDAGRIELRSTAVGHTTTAKRVDIIERSFRWKGDVLRYTMRMAAVGQPLTDHLSATLERVP